MLGSASSSAPPGLVEALAQAGLGGTAASEAALRHVAERRAEELVEHLEEVVGSLEWREIDVKVHVVAVLSTCRLLVCRIFPQTNTRGSYGRC